MFLYVCRATNMLKDIQYDSCSPGKGFSGDACEQCRFSIWWVVTKHICFRYCSSPTHILNIYKFSLKSFVLKYSTQRYRMWRRETRNKAYIYRIMLGNTHYRVLDSTCGSSTEAITWSWYFYFRNLLAEVRRCWTETRLPFPRRSKDSISIRVILSKTIDKNIIGQWQLKWFVLYRFSCRYAHSLEFIMR